LTNALTEWQLGFDGAPLVAHLLRETFADRWLRIHSLPDSQRYATSDTEYAELLRRQTTALADVVGSHCVIFVTEPEDDLLAQLAAIADDAPVCVDRVSIGRLDPVAFDDSAIWQIYACGITLADGCIDFLLRRVADDEIRNTIIVDHAFTRICHPYDGGMDLILSDATERESYCERYSAWLSQHPTGL
jgi:hypothetical protein